jgi:Flp pilus assembly pilin Flp
MGESEDESRIYFSREERRISWLEYALIAAGLAVVVAYGTQSISHTVREAYVRSQADQNATASVKKRAEQRALMDPNAPLQPMPVFPKQ